MPYCGTCGYQRVSEAASGWKYFTTVLIKSNLWSNLQTIPVNFTAEEEEFYYVCKSPQRQSSTYQA